MCLIINQPAGTRFDKEFIAGVYKRNDDGIGIMSFENGTLTVKKFLPKSLDEVMEIYETHIAEKECVVHFRMQTHGHIDLENCHPYEVMSEAEGYQLWMMHNGVLHTDNLKDKTKSDTWHYIRDYLRPILLKNPEFFMDPAFSELIGKHIGPGNKFVFMDARGNVVTVNKDQGVIHNNAWLSNTYAWDTTGTKFDDWGTFRWGYGSRPSRTKPSYLASLGFAYDEHDEYDDYTLYPTGNTAGDTEAIDPDERQEWVEYMAELLDMQYGHDFARNITTVTLATFYDTHGFAKSWRLAEDINLYEFSIEDVHDMLLEGLPETSL